VCVRESPRSVPDRRMTASFVIASSSSVGGRQSQEDRTVVVPDLNKHLPLARRLSGNEPARAFFGVFDGHGGQACSDFLSKKFHLELAKHAKLQSDPKAALLEVWDSMDGLFYESCVQKRKALLNAAKRKNNAFPV
ncbi:unnamed protein product, partial [Sphacelaria rigidula]